MPCMIFTKFLGFVDVLCAVNVSNLGIYSKGLRV